jgi:hypothetical protein
MPFPIAGPLLPAPVHRQRYRPGEPGLTLGSLFVLRDRLAALHLANALRCCRLAAQRRHRGGLRSDWPTGCPVCGRAGATGFPARATAAPVPLEPHLTDREIEARALQLAVRREAWNAGSSTLSPTGAGLLAALPPYAVAEVRRRAEELHQLLAERSGWPPAVGMTPAERSTDSRVSDSSRPAGQPGAPHPCGVAAGPVRRFDS